MEKLTEIMAQNFSGKIPYEEAKQKASPIIEGFNKRSLELAKKAKKRPILLSFEKMFGKQLPF